ncbi:hypothetical protein [Rhizobium leguminosarum]|uniref:hypothetical protein n=1 Tax=Rhizobium leguminosarum TaxID=384 RepID=UPI00103A733B|nr:hypothetical protein [Rhizobium leguminosarum]TBY40869.1 hypothetical protein E0H54_31775 [Rhizobium leguminosarum bv. viciae]
MRNLVTYQQYLEAHYLADVLLMKYAQEASIGSVEIQNDHSVAVALAKVAASLGYRLERAGAVTAAAGAAMQAAE